MSAKEKSYSVPIYTTSNRCPVRDPNAMLKMGKFEPNMLQDHHLIDILAHLTVKEFVSVLHMQRALVLMVILKSQMMSLIW